MIGKEDETFTYEGFRVDVQPVVRTGRASQSRMLSHKHLQLDYVQCRLEFEVEFKLYIKTQTCEAETCITID